MLRQVANPVVERPRNFRRLLSLVEHFVCRNIRSVHWDSSRASTGHGGNVNVTVRTFFPSLSS